VKKYLVEIPDHVVECDSFHDAVLVAKQNQPSTILRGTWVITRFPWPGEGPKVVVDAVEWTGVGPYPWER
jgi:hypothetical protein